jgi:solute carrier family 13 (sodium-dependent dicarboxylate transporter), member 2/3/5
MKKAINYPVVLIVAVLFCFLSNYPIFDNPKAQQAFALVIFAAILWVTEAIPLALTALAIPVLAILTGLAAPKEAFGEFANPVIFLFMGGFVLAGALSRHALDKLLAHKLNTLAKGNFYLSAILLMLATSLTACWVSNTSAAAMMLPLAFGMLALVKKDNITNESKFLMLGIAYSASIGGVITMVASPPNAIGAAILGLSFSGWMSYTFPLFLITFPAMVIVLTLIFKPDKKLVIEPMPVQSKKKSNNALIAIFFVTAGLWATDSMLSPLLNIANNFNALVAIMAVFMIFLAKVMTWDEIIESIQWKILLLFGGGLTLGLIVSNSGLGELLILKLSPLIQSVPLIVFVWIIVAVSIVLTEFMSNTASAALLLPLLFTVAEGLHINPMILVFPATIAASYGFMLPVGTPPNAMVFSSGLVRQKDMIKTGFVLNLLFSLLLTAFFYLVLEIK